MTQVELCPYIGFGFPIAQLKSGYTVPPAKNHYGPTTFTPVGRRQGLLHVGLYYNFRGSIVYDGTCTKVSQHFPDNFNISQTFLILVASRTDYDRCLTVFSLFMRTAYLTDETIPSCFFPCCLIFFAALPRFVYLWLLDVYNNVIGVLNFITDHLQCRVRPTNISLITTTV